MATLVEKNEVEFFGDLTGGDWQSVSPLFPNDNSGNNVFIDLVDGGAVNNGPIINAYASLDISFSQFFNNGAVQFRAAGGSFSSSNIVVHANDISELPGASSIFIAVAAGDVGNSNVDMDFYPWREDINDSPGGAMPGRQYDGNLTPFFRYIFGPYGSNYRQLLMHLDPISGLWNVVTDVISAPGTKKYIDSILKRVYFGASGTITGNDPTRVDFWLDSVSWPFLGFPNQVLKDSTTALINYDTGRWQDYMTIPSQLTSDYVNDVEPNITVENGTHNFGSSTKRLSMSLDSTSITNFYYPTFLDDPAVRNIRITIPLFWSSQPLFFLHLIKPTGNISAYILRYSSDQSLRLTDNNNNVLQNGFSDFGELPSPNTWFYIQIELIQGPNDNTISIRTKRNATSFNPGQYVPIQDSFGFFSNPLPPVIHDPGSGYELPYFVRLQINGPGGKTIKTTDLNIEYF